MKHASTQRWVLAATLMTGAVLALPPAVAAAPPAPAAPAPGKRDQAEVRYEQGKAYYKAGAFDLAIQEFLAGYELDPRSGVLFNIARAYEELKNRPRAIEFYQRYLKLGAAPGPAAEARARIVALERAIKDDDDRQKAEAAEREERRQREAAAAATAANAPPAVAASPAIGGEGQGTVTTSPPVPDGSPTLARNLKVAGIAAGAVGVALTGVSILFAVKGNNLNAEIRDETDKTGTWTSELTAKDDDRKLDVKIATITIIAGGAAVAGGAVLYYLGVRESSRVREVAVVPTGAMSLALVGRF